MIQIYNNKHMKRLKSKKRPRRRTARAPKGHVIIRQFQKQRLFPKLISVERLARFLGVCDRTIYRLACQGQIPALKIGDQWRFDLAVVYQWMEAKARHDARR